MGIRHAEFPGESSPLFLPGPHIVSLLESSPLTLIPPYPTKWYKKGQTDALTKTVHTFKCYAKVRGSVTSSTVRYTHDWCVLPCKVETGCDIAHYSIIDVFLFGELAHHTTLASVFCNQWERLVQNF